MAIVTVLAIEINMAIMGALNIKIVIFIVTLLAIETNINLFGIELSNKYKEFVLK